MKKLSQKIEENLNEHKSSDILRIQIGGDRGYYDWFFEKIDGTHFKMANAIDAIQTGAAMVHHVGQHRGETYYADLKKWLHDRVTTQELSGNKYKGNG